MAHPDDEILGCGATLRRLRNEGHRIASVVLCADADARADRPPDLSRYAVEAARTVGIDETANHHFKNIQFNTYPHIEIVKAIEVAIERFQPEMVFTLHPRDLNIDHRVTYEAAMAALMLPQRLTRPALSPTLIRKIYLCEVPSSTDWSPASTEPAFMPNAFFDVHATLEKKLEALQHFEGAMKPFPHSRSIENVRHLAHMRGAQAGIELAEAFVLVRDLVI
ncbi:MAG TPA: PIG-L deacetylase family protein [Thermoanaerobaculia bacterium]|nr:PIG-L deacetylase family protein [Thermoanaerobaculia bacterium]